MFPFLSIEFKEIQLKAPSKNPTSFNVGLFGCSCQGLWHSHKENLRFSALIVLAVIDKRKQKSRHAQAFLLILAAPVRSVRSGSDGIASQSSLTLSACAHPSVSDDTRFDYKSLVSGRLAGASKIPTSFNVGFVAAPVRLELTTLGLTVRCSTC